MNYQQIEQKSPEWWALKVGKVSGTRFSQLISTRENSLVYKMANEILDGCVKIDDYESEEMQFGTENEPIALDLYEQRTGVKFERGGVLLSDFSEIHMASPDGTNLERGIIAEVKCTMNGETQIKRFVEGIESDKLGQIVNYFACSNDVKEVHWISYCHFRPERDIVSIVFNRETVVKRKETKSRGLEVETIADLVEKGLKALPELETEINEVIKSFKQLDF
jgi:hypothetical protein